MRFTIVLGVMAGMSLHGFAYPTAYGVGLGGTFTLSTNQPLTEQGLLQIAPTSGTCDGSAFPNECRTASQALPAILLSFSKYSVTHPSVQAALISLMAYESGDFKYGINHFPGVLGQGTRNMQSAAFNEEYAASLDIEYAGDLGNMAEQLLDNDEASFGSAAWFLTTQCGPAVMEGLVTGGEQAWRTYLTGCVGTNPDEEGRLEYWGRAITVLGSG